jgi:Flp pilus assembly protein TadB
VTVIALFIPLVAAYLGFQETDYVRRFLTTPKGQVMLIVGISLYLIGLVWILRLLKPNY